MFPGHRKGHSGWKGERMKGRGIARQDEITKSPAGSRSHGSRGHQTRVAVDWV